MVPRNAHIPGKQIQLEKIRKKSRVGLLCGLWPNGHRHPHHASRLHLFRMVIRLVVNDPISLLGSPLLLLLLLLLRTK